MVGKLVTNTVMRLVKTSGSDGTMMLISPVLPTHLGPRSGSPFDPAATSSIYLSDVRVLIFREQGTRLSEGAPPRAA